MEIDSIIVIYSPLNCYLFLSDFRYIYYLATNYDNHSSYGISELKNYSLMEIDGSLYIYSFIWGCQKTHEIWFGRWNQ